MPATAPAATPIRFSAPPGRGPGIGVAPLIDIVLLLICFYLIVSKSMADLDDPAVRLPVLVHHEAAPPQPGELVLNLRQDGSIVLAGEAITPDALQAELAAARAGPGAAAPAVVVRADRRLPFRALARLQDLCRDAGYQTIVLRTLDRE